VKDLLIKQIIFTGKVLYQEGLVNSHAGNISVRYKDSILITKTGKKLGFLTKRDIVEVPVYSTSPQDKVASSELIVHRAIYQNTDYQAIIHAHPVYSVVISFFIEDTFRPIDNEGRLFLPEVPIIQVENPSGSKELAEKLSNFFSGNPHRCIIVKKHGSFTADYSLDKALKLTSDLEFCSKVYYKVKLKGG